MDRLRGFVDAVLAVVITILVLGIEPPTSRLGGDATREFLRELNLQLHPYIGSFALLAAYWIQHTVILAYVKQANRVFVWLNVLFLLPLSLTPFLTELRADNPQQLVITVLYAANQILCGLLLLSIWLYGTARGRFLDRELAPRVVRSMGIRIMLGPVIIVAAAIATRVSELLASVIFLTVPMLYMSHRTVDASWRRAAGEE